MNKEYNQPTSVPVPKVKAVGIAGVIVTAVVTVLAAFGVLVPADVSDAAVGSVAAIVALVSLLQIIVTFAAGYFKKDVRSTDNVTVERGR